MYSFDSKDQLMDQFSVEQHEQGGSGCVKKYKHYYFTCFLKYCLVFSEHFHGPLIWEVLERRSIHRQPHAGQKNKRSKGLKQNLMRLVVFIP